MKLTNPISAPTPTIAYVVATSLSFLEGGDVQVTLVFNDANGNCLDSGTMTVRDASNSETLIVNPNLVPGGDLIVPGSGVIIPMGAGQLKLAARSGTDDASSLDAVVAKLVSLNLLQGIS